MNPSQIDGCAYSDSSSLHRFRTELPNILFAMNLDPWQFKAYCVMKWTAGDTGSCYKSNNTLSDEVGCSVPTLIKIKKELLDLGLISIIKRKHDNGSALPDLIEIIDIWPLNMEIMSKKYPRDKSKDPKHWKENKTSNFNEGTKPDLAGVVNGVNEGTKPGLHKEDLFNKELFEQQPQAPSAVVVNLNLDLLDIESSLKFKISSEYSSDQIDIAVQRCLRWKSRNSDQQGIMTALNKASTWIDNPSKEEVVKSNEEFLKKYAKMDGMRMGNTIINVGNKYIEFVAGMKIDTFTIDEEDFKIKVKEYFEYLKKLL